MNKKIYPKLAWSNLKKNSKVYIPYIISCITTFAMFYIMHAISINQALDNISGGASLKSILYLGTIVIGIFSVIILFYTNSFLIKRRKKEIGLYNILGMEKKHIAIMMSWESIYTFIITIAFGIMFGILLSKLMFLLLMKLLAFNVAFVFEISKISIVYTLILFAGIFILTLAFNLIQISLSKPIELLHSDKSGEKEPKTKLIMTIIGVALLAAAYYIAITTENPIKALSLFFVAVIMVIVGTYLLFTAGSIVLLKALRKNKNYYYKTNHFISTSSMIYRMKQNAAGLASICILCTVVLIMISSTISIYIGMKDIMKTRFPREFSISSMDADDKSINNIKDLVADKLAQYNIEAKDMIEYRANDFITVTDKNNFYLDTKDMLDDSFNNASIIYFISLEDYNRLTGNDKELTDTQALITKADDEIAFDSIVIGEDEYTIAGNCSDFPVVDDSMANYYDTYYIIINSSEKMLQYYNINTGNNYTKMDYECMFDLSGDKEDIYNFAKDARTAVMELGSTRVESRQEAEESFYALYGGLFFLGIFLGALFLAATVLIIYYKQVSEGYEDKDRFEIMQKVGLSQQEIKKSIKSQVLKVFFLPIIMAVVHIAFAFKMITKLLALLNLTNVTLFIICTIVTVLVFSIVYAVVYMLTARVYYKIVK